MRFSTAIATLLACLIAGTAQAHAKLEKSTPAEGSTLTAAPAGVDMTFSEAVRLTSVSVQKEKEPRQVIGDLPAGADKTLHVALPQLTAGAYTLAWRVVGADGHVSFGAVHFTISKGEH